MKSYLELYHELITNGGFTYQPVTGEVPTDGYMVSNHPECSKIKPVKECSPAYLLMYVVFERKTFYNPENFFGAWLDKKTNKVYLDVVCKVPFRERAISLAKEHDQIAIYDLADQEEIYI